MRDILFRGQTRRKGEYIVNMAGDKCESHWVYGGIFPQNKDGDFAIIYQQEPEIRKFTVYAETVGQYTGLTDKNGKRIFEGDILKSTITIIDCNDEGYSISHHDREDIGIVEWRKDGFMIAHKSGTWARSFYGCENYVIGNIHDNPELLGGENNGINR